MNLKKIVEVSPLIAAYLIFLGFYKLDSYYNHWNISISQYLDFSEILLSFMKDLNIVLFFLLVLVIQAVIGLLSLDSIDRRKQSNAEQSGIVRKRYMDEIEEHFDQYPRTVKIVLFILTVILVSAFLYFLNLSLLYLSFMTFIQLSGLLIHKPGSNETFSFQIIVVTILFAFTFCISKYQIHETEKSRIRFSIETSEGKTFSTVSNYLYLGKTNNFVFLYDRTLKQTIILPTDSVKEIQFSSYKIKHD